MSIEEANIQVSARLVPDVLTLYVDETVGPGAGYAREMFALADVLPGEGYVQAGKFLLPYGYRLPDDAEYIRSRTALRTRRRTSAWNSGSGRVGWRSRWR